MFIGAAVFLKLKKTRDIILLIRRAGNYNPLNEIRASHLIFFL